MKLDDIYNRIGNKVSARRHKKNGEYVKKDIAKALHVNPQDISNWAFRNKFPWEELFSFSREHKMPFHELLTGEQPAPCSIGCDAEMRKTCKKVKDIYDSKSHWWDSLSSNIDSLKKGVDRDKEKLTKEKVKGQKSGTQKPAMPTGSKKKVG